MNHIVTISLVIFSLTQLSAVQSHGPERLRMNYERADALARSIVTVTISLDEHEQQVALLNTTDAILPQIASVAIAKKHSVVSYTGSYSTEHGAVKNNSP
jgi:hypothetical protein